MTNWLSYVSWKRSQPFAHLLFLSLKDINAIEKTSLLQFVKLHSKYPNKI